MNNNKYSVADFMTRTNSQDKDAVQAIWIFTTVVVYYALFCVFHAFGLID